MKITIQMAGNPESLRCLIGAVVEFDDVLGVVSGVKPDRQKGTVTLEVKTVESEGIKHGQGLLGVGDC